MISRPVVTHTTSADVQVRAVDAGAAGGQMRFVARSGATAWRCPTLAVTLRRPASTTRNALAAIAVATELELPTRRSSPRSPGSLASTAASSATASTRSRRRTAAGASRWSTTTPPSAEMAAVFPGGSTRRVPGRRLVLAFQPHRHAHARLLRGLRQVMSTADVVLLDGGLLRRRGADRRRRRPQPWRVPCVAGKVDPLFFDDVAELTHGDCRAWRATATS